MTPPIFKVIGDDRLSDEAIEALAALLLSVAEAENTITRRDEDKQEDPSAPTARCV